MCSYTLKTTMQQPHTFRNEKDRKQEASGRRRERERERERMHSERSGVIRRAASADGTQPHRSETSVTGSHTMEGLKLNG